jgi:hypothetical protein
MYAQLKQSGWHFYVRAGARVRPLEYHEIAARFGARVGAANDANVKGAEALIAQRSKSLAVNRHHLWVGLMPVWPTAPHGSERVALNVKAVDLWLSDPAATGNRSNGWTFANPYVSPVHSHRKVMLSGGQTRLELHADGLVSFTAALERLVWSDAKDLLANAPLCEFPTSLARLVRTLIATPSVCQEPPRSLFMDIAMTGAKGWKLSRFDPLRQVPMPWHVKTCSDDGDLTWPEPLQFDAAEVADNPDRCAMRLVDRVYQAFGFRDDELPDLFDRVTGKLVLP